MRGAIQNGQLTLPLEYYNNIKNVFGVKIANITRAMFEAAWYNYLLNKGTISLPYWSQRFNNPKAFNIILRELSNEGWLHCVTMPNYNWSEAKLREEKLLEFASMKDLELVRADYKFNKYTMNYGELGENNLSRLNGKVKHTGLTRDGFYKTNQTEFKFDTDVINDNYEVIVQETNKGMEKVREFYPEMNRDTASYDEISEAVIQNVLYNKNMTYRSGGFTSDSRGRDISDMLRKVFNPIGFKVARAALIIPE